MNGVIYMYTSPSGKRYIGQTVNEDHRKYHHSKAPTTSAFHAAVRKYGIDAFEYKVLHKNISSKAVLNLLETLEIISRKTLAPDGYNLNTGGDSRLASDEAKSRLSKAHSGSRRPHRDRPVICVETGERFNSRTEAATAYNTSASRISSALNSHSRTCNGMHWFEPAAITNCDKSKFEYKESRKKTVQCYETSEVFTSLSSAAVSIGKERKFGSAISAVLNDPHRTYGGYHWVTDGVRHKSVSTPGGKPSKRRRVMCVETSRTYESLMCAAETHSLKSHTLIISAIKRNGTAGGYHWQYID